MDRTGQLLTQVASGDREALESLLQTYLPELHAYVRLQMGPGLQARESTSDLVQSVCREVLQDLGEFDYRGEPAFKAWLFLTAQRKVADRARYYGRDRRDAAREEQLLTDQQMATGYRSLLSPSEAAIRQEEIEGLEAAFAKLPEDYRQVITMARFLHLPHAEIARRMNKTEGATKVLLHRAMVRLAFLMDE